MSPGRPTAKMSKLKVMSVFGTRPEAIKMAPLALELQRRESIESLICVTAQHREMLDSVMHCFGLNADADLNIMGKNQTLTDVTVKALKGLEAALRSFAPISSLSTATRARPSPPRSPRSMQKYPSAMSRPACAPMIATVRSPRR